MDRFVASNDDLTRTFGSRSLDDWEAAQLNEIDAALKHLAQARVLGTHDTDKALCDVITSLTWLKEEIEG